jgi:hypothetical protein
MSDKYKEWYAANADKLSDKRRLRYQTDPAYREAAIKRAAEAREAKRQEKPAIQGSTLAEVAELLSVSTWTLNNWRNLKYYPEPDRMLGRPVFNGKQVQLLGLIAEFFNNHPRKAAAAHRSELQGIVDVVFHNWRL